MEGTGDTGGAESVRLVCDASLGGLARWLRAAGYEAAWSDAWRGNAAVEAARARGAVLVTTETELRERRVVRLGELRLVWVSSRERTDTQLAAVVRELGLVAGEPRCMACGGRLAAVEKAAVRERIPPRTALWLDDYWECSGCRQLFWKGTHWGRIRVRVAAAFGRVTGTP